MPGRSCDGPGGDRQQEGAVLAVERGAIPDPTVDGVRDRAADDPLALRVRARAGRPPTRRGRCSDPRSARRTATWPRRSPPHAAPGRSSARRTRAAAPPGTARDAVPGRGIRPVGDDHLGVGCRPAQRLEAAPRYGNPLTDATTTESCGPSVIGCGARRGARRLTGCPRDVEHEQRRQREDERRTRGARGETTSCAVRTSSTTGTSGAAATRTRFAGRPSTGAPLPSVGATVLPPLTDERAEARRASHGDDDGRVVQQRRPAGCERAVDVRLPEPVAPTSRQPPRAAARG